MVLAEKYLFEAKRLVADPQIEIASEKCRRIARVRFHAWAAPGSGRNSKTHGLIIARCRPPALAETYMVLDLLFSRSSAPSAVRPHQSQRHGQA